MRPVDTIHKRNLFFDSLDSPYMERYFDIWINRDPAARHSFPEKLIAGRFFP